MPVYDDENNSPWKLPRRRRRRIITTTEQSAAAAPADSPEEQEQEQPEDAGVVDDSSNAGNSGSTIAQDIRNQENEAAKGGLYAGDDESSGTSGRAAGRSKDKTGIGTRSDLADQEDRPFMSGNPARPSGNLKTEFKGLLKNQLKKFGKGWVIGALSGFVGAGIGVVILAMLSGGFQFIHAGRAFEQFHFTVQEQQTGIMAMKLSRNIYQVANDQRERTRLGSLGNLWADVIEARMRENGYTFDFRSGAFRGYIIDPGKFNNSQYPGLTDNESETVREYFKRHYDVDATINGNRLYVEPTGSYFKDVRFLRTTMRNSGMGAITYLNSHIIKKKMRFTLNPMQRWIQDKDNRIIESTERRVRKSEFLKRQRTYIRNGITAVRMAVQVGTDQDGNAPNQQAADETNDLLNKIDEAQQALDEGDTSKLNEFRSGLGGKLSAGGLAAIGILCFIKALSEQWDLFRQNKIEDPMIRMGMQSLSWGSANEDGGSDVVDEEANGYMSELYYDPVAQTSWTDACSVQSEFGRPQTEDCVDLPEYARYGDGENVMAEWLNAIPGLDQACTTVGQVILIGVSAIILGPLATTTGVIVGIASGPLIAEFTKWVMDTLLGNQVDALASGGLRGAFMENGVFLAANAYSLSSAGLPTPEAVSQELTVSNRQQHIDEFQSQSLAYRLFNKEDPRSVFAQVIDNQSPDPAHNLSRTASGLLGIGRNFSSTLFRPILGKANAQYNYDRGRTITAFLPEMLNHPALENPYAVAEEVADILDANADEEGVNNYIRRAKICFDKDIIKTPATAPDGQAYEQYAMGQPQDGSSTPLHKDVMNPDNKCFEGQTNTEDGEAEIDVNHPWIKVRAFIFGSDVMNSMACGLGGPGNEESQRACADVGNEANSGSGE